MKINGIIEEVPITSTDENPQKYTLSITGTGTMEECNHAMDLLMQDGPGEWCDCEELPDGADACPHWVAWGKCKKRIEKA